MFKNYIKVTLRYLLNQKYYTLINMMGLALGLAACIMILLFVQDELSYEKQFSNHDKIYRLVQDFPMGDHLSQSATVPFPSKPTMMEDFSSIDKSSLLFRPSSWGNPTMINKGDDVYYEDNFVYAEHDFLEMFEFEYIKGSPKGAFLGPNELIVSESTAKKYFGENDPIGQTLRLNNFRDLEVIAVIKDLPHNTHLKFDLLASFETFKSFVNNHALFESQWVWVAAWFYFTVDSPDDIERIRGQLDSYVKKHYPPALADKGIALKIQEVDKIHLTSSRELEFKANGNMQHVYIFASIAFLILLIAIINFMNLATSRSVKRSKEVGLRKVLGAKKEMLITQFMGEALLTVTISLIVALFIIYNALPWFNQLTGKDFSIEFFKNPVLLIGVLVLLVFVGIVSGSYPSLVLSSFQPSTVLKGKAINVGSSVPTFRKVLVISQFVVSITLMICIGIVVKQLRYVHTLDLGFNKDQIMLVDINFNQANQYTSFKNTLLENASKEASMLGGSIPGQEEIIEHSFVKTGQPTEEQQWFSIMFAGLHFEDVLELEFVEGHGFQEGSDPNSAGFIINEATAAALGWEGEAIGQSLDRINSTDGNILQTGQVIGVVKDYHYRPLYDPIKPLVIRMANLSSKMCIKIDGNNVSTTIAGIEEAWKNQFEGLPIRYSFMDKDYDQLYAKEDSLSKTVKYFSILAIFIACLGLLGLSSYSTENRKKEIGIRKVNGATTIELLGLLMKDFSKLILIAFGISIPISYYFGNWWLNDFAYRTSIDIGIFLIAGVLSLCIATITVSYHTLRAATRNPVKSLRYE